ncbi:2-amino-4-hydroxy-6-hydroxymethyldihydropteridine diphosphokinase [Desertivirga brevis]|uniref:2-amino-4-hydroxy-6- hydroxymethyldihydropteridine diphosphokinase n=1 Tax=Desertivirga brevis TaxID=2810310 RepID=UPI001A96299A|nr:2-amino-4-hydroxy-6-hydroxymethyldihydropteridine diphosphokinase [Pedobacter sp. SYSU D00873]
MQEVYLLLGSNIGDREQFLHQATLLLTQEIGAITKKSSLYETAPWGLEEQPEYLNQVLVLVTKLQAREVLKAALDIEKILGRERIERWGSRVIDIDILFYSDEVIDEADLKVPHPYFHLRRFAVEPMLEVQPDFIHPVLKKSIKSLALELSDQLYVQKINFNNNG